MFCIYLIFAVAFIVVLLVWSLCWAAAQTDAAIAEALKKENQ